ncbi:hypothetical protein J7F03_22570 [Streptomyces sp. ISL-43]|uniref:hypothetical protein n=1 Tax=Streptomyces sp. ISL-43 TaxID=2819183 RepID=UPI001BEAE397|nr:hypothetical protein [Streptomyces sp. ISL-43]MBT2449806.1 hypothetical protein [Streptomyces sp. ISL-43]
MFELLPGIGVLLPGGAGVLRFGMGGDAVREVLGGLGEVWGDRGVDGPADADVVADVLSDVLSDVAWVYAARWSDAEVAAHACAPDRPVEPGGGPTLAGVVLKRFTGQPGRPGMPGRARWHGPAAVPVVLGDIDLFGYPADEVAQALEGLEGLEALEAPGREPRRGFRSVPPGGYPPSVCLWDAPPPKDGGAGGPDLASYADMWTTGRDDWQLEDTGSGYLITTKGDPPMHLPICHDELAEQIIARMLAAGVEVVPA